MNVKAIFESVGLDRVTLNAIQCAAQNAHIGNHNQANKWRKEAGIPLEKVKEEA